MTYNYFLIDASNLFWRNFSVSLKNFITKDNIDIYPQSIHFSLKKIEKLIKEFGNKDTIVYLCFDNPDSNINIRKYLSEGDYKSIRSKKTAPKGLYNSLSLFYEILRNYSDQYILVNVDSLEADDLTFPIINKLKLNKNNQALVISNDMDWGRNIDKNVKWYNYNKVYDDNEFKKDYKFDPKNKKIQLYKCIHGDGSDSIKNAVPYLPEKSLLYIIENFNDIQDLLDNLWKEETDISKDWKFKISDASHQLKINYQLVDFIKLDGNIEEYYFKCNRNIKILELWYDALGIEKENFMINSPTDFFRKKKF